MSKEPPLVCTGSGTVPPELQSAFSFKPDGVWQPPLPLTAHCGICGQMVNVAATLVGPQTVTHPYGEEVSRVDLREYLAASMEQIAFARQNAISRRDMFAAAALQGLLADPSVAASASAAVKLADELIKALDEAGKQIDVGDLELAKEALRDIDENADEGYATERARKARRDLGEKVV